MQWQELKNKKVPESGTEGERWQSSLWASESKAHRMFRLRFIGIFERSETEFF